MHRKNKKIGKIGLIAPTSENEVLSWSISSASLLIEPCACAKVQKRNFISSASCGIFKDLFSKLRCAIKKALRILYTIGPITKVNIVIFLRNKRFNINFVISDYQLRSAHAAKHVWVSFVNLCTPPPLTSSQLSKHSILHSVTEN